MILIGKNKPDFIGEMMLKI